MLWYFYLLIKKSHGEQQKYILFVLEVKYIIGYKYFFNALIIISFELPLENECQTTSDGNFVLAATLSVIKT